MQPRPTFRDVALALRAQLALNKLKTNGSRNNFPFDAFLFGLSELFFLGDFDPALKDLKVNAEPSGDADFFCSLLCVPLCYPALNVLLLCCEAQNPGGRESIGHNLRTAAREHGRGDALKEDRTLGHQRQVAPLKRAVFGLAFDDDVIVSEWRAEFHAYHLTVVHA